MCRGRFFRRSARPFHAPASLAARAAACAPTIGALAHDEREREPRLLSARQMRDGRRRHVAADVEPAQVIAQRLLAGRRLEALEMRKRRLLGAQRLDLMLREIADAQILMDEALAGD